MFCSLISEVEEVYRESSIKSFYISFLMLHGLLPFHSKYVFILVMPKKII